MCTNQYQGVPKGSFCVLKSTKRYSFISESKTKCTIKYKINTHMYSYEAIALVREHSNLFPKAQKNTYIYNNNKNQKVTTSNKIYNNNKT